MKKLFRFLATFIGRMHAPYTHKRMTFKELMILKTVMKPGGVLLTKTKGELTNFFIPGFWKHSAMYIGNGMVIEAIGRGVTLTPLDYFIYTKDFIAYVEPKFTDKEGMASACEWAKTKMGAPYDYNFLENDDEFYCGELVVDGYQNSTDKTMSFHGEKILNEKVYKPNGIFKSSDLWQLIFDSRKVK